MQSILSAHGPAATAIAELAWVLFAGGAAILLAVLVLTAYAVSARPAWLAREGFIVAAGIAFPVLALSVLLAYVYVIGSPNAAPSGASLKIEVIAEQWWWRIRYPGFETANEIRIPAGRPVELVLRSADVIHSFWVPSLAGKVDMIPGRDNRLRLIAQKAGEFRGQCAEFCGGPHAKMALHVIAEDPERFETWTKNQLQEVRSSHALFLARCAVCHTVRGTAAAGTRGPDLTHVASRRFIAAGALPNTQGNLAGWIAGSQHIKPGNLMPAMNLSGVELQALAGYLASLE
jgi:cytochrome c oxidase subunit 2